MQVAAAELLGGDVLAGRGLHQRRARQEDGALLLDDHGLVGHRRDVRAAGGAGTEDRGDLRNALLGQVRLVVEDAAEVVAVREDLVLVEQHRAARVDQVDAGQAVGVGDLLGAEVLLHRHRVVGAAGDGGVVGHDHAASALDESDAGDDRRRRRCRRTSRGRPTARPREGAARVEQLGDALADQQLAAETWRSRARAAFGGAGRGRRARRRGPRAALGWSAGGVGGRGGLPFGGLRGSARSSTSPCRSGPVRALGPARTLALMFVNSLCSNLIVTQPRFNHFRGVHTPETADRPRKVWRGTLSPQLTRP